MKTFSQFLSPIVAFDFANLRGFDFLQFGFTETESWSDPFETLGYDSCNLVVNMGTSTLIFGVFFAWFLLTLIFEILRRITGRLIPLKFIRKQLGLVYMMQG